MVIYHYVERICRIIVTPKFFITYIISNTYYPGGTVNIYTIINGYYSGEQLSNLKKKGKGKLTLFCGIVERVITIYDMSVQL